MQINDSLNFREKGQVGDSKISSISILRWCHIREGVDILRDPRDSRRMWWMWGIGMANVACGPSCLPFTPWPIPLSLSWWNRISPLKTSPSHVDGVKRFEKLNSFSINVIGFLEEGTLFPLYMTENHFDRHFDLLLYESDTENHYVYVKHFDRLLWTMTKSGHISLQKLF